MTEFSYDPDQASLYVGQTALDIDIENGLVDPRDIENLRVLLQDNQNEAVSTPNRAADIDDWDRDTYIAQAAWMLTLAAKEPKPGEAPEGLKENQFTLLYNRGLGPHHSRYRKRFGSMVGVNAELGPTTGRQPGRFSSWTMRDLVEYSAQLLEQKGSGWLMRDDYQAAYKRGDGPSLTFIERRTTVSKLQELLGRANPAEMEPDDYVTWAIDALDVNDVNELSTLMIDFLSSKGRGPSTYSIRSVFGSLGGLQIRVSEELPKFKIRKQEALDNLKSRFMMLLGASIQEVPSTEEPFVEPQKMAQYMLVHELNGADSSTIEAIVNTHLKSTIMNLCRRHDMSFADVEVVAHALGIYEFLWPMDEYKKHLKIDPGEYRRWSMQRRYASSNPRFIQSLLDQQT